MNFNLFLNPETESDERTKNTAYKRKLFILQLCSVCMWGGGGLCGDKI
jgi:hypothetical protein